MSRDLQSARIVRRIRLLASFRSAGRVAIVLATVGAGWASAGSGADVETKPSPADQASSPAAKSVEAQPHSKPSSLPAKKEDAAKEKPKEPRLASTSGSLSTHVVLKPSLTPSASASEIVDPITKAIRKVADCQLRYQEVSDYSCTFYKRERIDGKLTPHARMTMKVRTSPRASTSSSISPTGAARRSTSKGRNDGRVAGPRRRHHASSWPAPLSWIRSAARAMEENPAPGHRGRHRRPDRDGREAVGRSS